MQGYKMLPKVLCGSCRHLHSAELINGHRRRGFCSVGAGWVRMEQVRQCLYYKAKRK